MAKVQSRWVGASIRLTGMTGLLDTVAAAAESGRSWRDVLTRGALVATSCGFLCPLPGVEGYEDRRRGVPFMA